MKKKSKSKEGARSRMKKKKKDKRIRDGDADMRDIQTKKTKVSVSGILPVIQPISAISQSSRRQTCSGKEHFVFVDK